MNPQDYSNLLQDAFDELLKRNPTLQELIVRISDKGGKMVVFGGWSRDVIAKQVFAKPVEPRDIDLVVTGLESSQLRALLPENTLSSALGGYKCQMEEVVVDIWCIQDTYTLVKRGLPFEVDLLPDTTVFSIEAIIFKPEQSWGTASVIDKGVADSFTKGFITLGRGEVPLPEAQVGRVLQYSEKLGLELGADVVAFIKKVLDAPEARAKVIEGLHQYAQPRYLEGALLRLAQL